jgi:hypothetical protein
MVKQKQKQRSSSNLSNIILIILATISLFIAIMLIIYLLFKNSCKDTFKQKFPNYGECIYNVLNQNLTPSQMNQICNSILNCNESTLNSQLHCLQSYLDGLNLKGGSGKIISSIINECNIHKYNIPPSSI